MNRVTATSFFSTIVIGLNKGYSDENFTKPDLIGFLQEYQRSRIHESKVFLSAAVSECEIVLNYQVEPHIKLDFINYPKFPLSFDIFKHEIEKCACYLMDKMEQNRIVIAFNDETVMLEKSSQVDPGVLKL